MYRGPGVYRGPQRCTVALYEEYAAELLYYHYSRITWMILFGGWSADNYNDNTNDRDYSTGVNDTSRSALYRCILITINVKKTLKTRLHDTTCCQTGCQSGLTTGYMFVYTIQPVVKPVCGCQSGLTSGWRNNHCSFNTVVKPDVTTGWTNSGCSFNTVVKPAVQPGLTTCWTNRCSLTGPVECLFTRYSRLSNRLYNRFDNRLYRVNGV